MENVIQHANGRWYVDIRVPTHVRAVLGVNYRRSLGSKVLDRATKAKATSYIAEFHQRVKEAEKEITERAEMDRQRALFEEMQRKRRDEEEQRLATLEFYRFADPKKHISEFIDFAAGGFPNAETSEEIFNEALRRLTKGKNSAKLLNDVEAYILCETQRIETARRLVEAAKIPQTQSVVTAFDKTLTVTKLLEKLNKTEPPKPDTLRQYRTAVSLFIERCGDKPIVEIDRNTARAFRDFLHEREDLSYGTCDQRMKKVRALFNFAVREGFIVAPSPFDGLNVNKEVKEGHGESDPGKYLPPEIVNVYLNDIIPRFPFESSMRWPILIMFFTGMRVEECCGLRLDEVVNHWGVNCFHIRPRPEDRAIQFRRS